MKRTRWSMATARAIRADLESGHDRTWATVAAEHGMSVPTLYDRLRVRGMLPDMAKRPQREHPQDGKVIRAIAIRNTEGLTWAAIAPRVGWVGTLVLLRVRVSRYAKRHGVEVAIVYPRRGAA